MLIGTTEIWQRLSLIWEATMLSTPAKHGAPAKVKSCPCLSHPHPDHLCIFELYFTAYKYAGTQHRTQCFCDDSFGKYNKVADSQCDDKCPKEQQQSCGGTWRNSVYDTNYLGEFAILFTRQMCKSISIFTQYNSLRVFPSLVTNKIRKHSCNQAAL